MANVFDEIDENIQEITTDESEELPIIPTDTFKIIVETYDEYQIIKGFPENDTRQGNEFDHDYSLDRIGQIDGIPRKQYIETNDYAHTEPPYNNRLTEDDYHYMNRILNYNLKFHNTPRPVLEIWKIYGIFSDMVNREKYLFKMFDEKHHLDNKTKIYNPDWTPKAWEHKDKLCELTSNLGQFFCFEYFHSKYSIETTAKERFFAELFADSVKKILMKDAKLKKLHEKKYTYINSILN